MVFECFFNDILDSLYPFSGIEWYFKLPLRVPQSSAEISLILNVAFNGNQLYIYHCRLATFLGRQSVFLT